MLKANEEAAATAQSSKESNFDHHPPAQQNPPPTASGTAGASFDSTLNSEVDQALLKEEEDFLKMESIFISELGLETAQLPKFLAK